MKGLKKIKGKVTKEDLLYILEADTEEEFKKRMLEVRAKSKVTDRVCKFCKKHFQRIEDGLLDYQIKDKEICSMCANKKGLLKGYVEESNGTLPYPCGFGG